MLRTKRDRVSCWAKTPFPKPLSKSGLKEWRAVATRYEQTAHSFLGVLSLAATCDWLRVCTRINPLLRLGLCHEPA